MKQLAFMVFFTLLGTAGSFAYPFFGVFVYYLFAVMRPQFIWMWTPEVQGITWSFYVAVATMIAAGLGLFGAVKVQPGEGPARPFRPSAAHFCVLAFAVWVGVTYLTAYSPEAGAETFYEYLKIFVMYVVSAYVIRTLRQVWSLLFMIALALGYVAYEVNYAYFVNHYLAIYHTGYGGLDNNGAGLMLAMAVPACWFSFESTKRWWRWGFVLLIPFIVHAVLMTYSRGAMVSLILMCPLLLWRSQYRVLLALSLVGFTLLLLPTLAGPEIRARFLTLEQSDQDASANSRRQSWAAAWAMAQDHPLLGVGLRNANLFSHQYGADFEGRTIHSQYLQVLADNGFPGLGLYLAVLGSAWWCLRRSRRAAKGRDDPDARLVRAVAGGIECSMAVYCTGAFFLSLEVFELPYLLFLMSAQLAVVTAAEPGPVLGTAHVRGREYRQPSVSVAGRAGAAFDN
jgi:probable O-glycosylation ligase (exosortase A-associated)